MGNKLYVGNLPFSATEEALQAEFAKVGNVDSVKIITDRATGRSKGFAFVEMSDAAEAQDAIGKYNGFSLDGRAMNVSEAKPQENRKSRSGGSFRPRTAY